MSVIFGYLRMDPISVAYQAMINKYLGVIVSLSNFWIASFSFLLVIPLWQSSILVSGWIWLWNAAITTLRWKIKPSVLVLLFLYLAMLRNPSSLEISMFMGCKIMERWEKMSRSELNRIVGEGWFSQWHLTFELNWTWHLN